LRSLSKYYDMKCQRTQIRKICENNNIKYKVRKSNTCNKYPDL
jgi:tRNA(Ile)-lysidine synthase TilS/MesJ